MAQGLATLRDKHEFTRQDVHVKASDHFATHFSIIHLAKFKPLSKFAETFKTPLNISAESIIWLLPFTDVYYM